MSTTNKLKVYRDSLPTITKNCECCGTGFETKADPANPKPTDRKYCSANCKSNAHREAKRKEKTKDQICYFCGCHFDTKRKTKFCSEDHKVLFHNAVKAKRKITIVIDAKTKIITDKYDRIPQIVAKLKAYMKSDKAGPPGYTPGAGPATYQGKMISADMY